MTAVNPHSPTLSMKYERKERLFLVLLSQKFMLNPRQLYWRIYARDRNLSTLRRDQPRFIKEVPLLRNSKQDRLKISFEGKRERERLKPAQKQRESKERPIDIEIWGTVVMSSPRVGWSWPKKRWKKTAGVPNIEIPAFDPWLKESFPLWSCTNQTSRQTNRGYLQKLTQICSGSSPQ